MDINDFFGSAGAMPPRPEHPDFWRLSEVVLSNDAPMEEAGANVKDKEAAWEEQVRKYIDEHSLTYMAVQRAFRAFGITTRGQLIERAEEVARYAGVWMDAFCAGAAFERAGGHREV